MILQKLFWFCNADEFSSEELTKKDSGIVIYNPEVSLFKLKSGDFQIIMDGEMKAILNGDNYLLLRKDIAKFLNRLFPSIVSESEVKIIDPVTKMEWLNYSEISIGKAIDYKDFHDFQVEGLQIYQMFNSCIFVSADLRVLLIDTFSNLDGMTFKPMPLFVV